MEILDELMARAEADSRVRGVILTGSHARGLATAHSDVDVTVVLPDADHDWRRDRTGVVDLAWLTVDQLADTSDPWQRYAFRGARVLLDRGGVAELVGRQAEPTGDEARHWAEDYLDGYVNLLYRAAKSRRDGHPGAALLDEQESVSWLLGTVFALYGRVRPYSKYLKWELSTFPLPEPWNDHLAPEHVAHHPVELFPAVERLARERGHGELLDSWGTDIDLIRNSRRGAGQVGV
ncbi:nucleotidyltransferase domain-containing protein [Actinoplanes sp. LDG1-06]|uniref:Nucleotidyltransferase domain-containing protein n=1 Tax=Paractinoplanes ovalisporus TaxID=2810368 RepID=A0ABS2A7Z3_9ACTN|nr:nucleotidyltransferase domain-containing protein [Actinoplanes ovalisporus]MBM2615959.1 nucleotidyltransferase domain-containing protein [Actinoplanes ovalisporus]